MDVVCRRFDPDRDFDGISGFLRRHYRPLNRDGNWFQQIWEYSYTHPLTDHATLERIGIFEDGEEMVGATIFDMYPVDATLVVHPAYRRLRPRMAADAEEHLAGPDSDGVRTLRIFACDFDEEWNAQLADLGYTYRPDLCRAMSRIRIPGGMAERSLHDGFRFLRAADIDDNLRMRELLWKGFNHEGPYDPQPGGNEQRFFEGPNFRADLTTIVQASSGELVSYCGMWYDERHRYGYVEPVATVPGYRGRGIGGACVLEAVRRAGAAGATEAYVWTDMRFYLDLGFEKLFTHNCWVKTFG